MYVIRHKDLRTYLSRNYIGLILRENKNHQQVLRFNTEEEAIAFAGDKIARWNYTYEVKLI